MDRGAGLVEGACWLEEGWRRPWPWGTGATHRHPGIIGVMVGGGMESSCSEHFLYVPEMVLKKHIKHRIN